MKKSYLNIILAIILLSVMCWFNNMINENFEEQNMREKNFKEIVHDDKKDKIYVRINDIIVNEPVIYKNDVLNFDKFTNLSNTSFILDAGCGTGRNIKEIIKLYPQVEIEGIDISKNMINRARINNPGANLLCTSLVDPNIYKQNILTHILCMRTTLNENSLGDISRILTNFHKWLRKDGCLILNITDPNKLDPAPRAFSQYYKSDNNVKHSLTYFEGFTHDAWWEKVKDKSDWYQYCEKIMFSDKNFIIKTTKLLIPPVKKILDYITKHNFKIKEIIEIDDFNRDDYSMYIFAKK